MIVFESFFDMILLCGPLFHYVLAALVPFMIVLMAIGIIWGLCVHVFNR